MKQKIYTGYDSYKKIYDILSKFSPKKIFLVTGKKSYFLSGAKKILSKFINEYEHIRFFDFEINPRIKDINRGIDLWNLLEKII